MRCCQSLDPFNAALVSLTGPKCQAATSIGDGILPTIVWPSDVVAYKRRIDPSWQATNTSVAQCAALSAADRAAWQSDFAAWTLFFKEDVPFFGSANKYDEAQQYEKRLAAWQDLLSKTSCTLSGPKVTPPDKIDLSVVKWVAGAAIAVAGVYALSQAASVARAVKAAL